MFSVGVVVDRTGVLTSKNGKKFISVKFSDLQKFDREKVRKSMAQTLGPDSAKIQMNKLYNKNMYRVITIMCFGDSAVKIAKVCLPGTVMAVIGPKFMPAKAGQNEDQHLTYTIESDANLVQIGYCFDYDVCKGQDSNPRTPSVKCPCIQFVNKSVERMCDRHKLEVT